MSFPASKPCYAQKVDLSHCDYQTEMKCSASNSSKSNLSRRTLDAIDLTSHSAPSVVTGIGSKFYPERLSRLGRRIKLTIMKFSTDKINDHHWAAGRMRGNCVELQLHRVILQVFKGIPLGAPALPRFGSANASLKQSRTK